MNTPHCQFYPIVIFEVWVQISPPVVQACTTAFPKHMYRVHYWSDPILLGQHLTLERLSQFSSRLSQTSSRVNYTQLLLIYSQNKCLSLANFDSIGKIIP